MGDEAPAPHLWLSLRAADARGLIHFLVEVFGFVEVAVYGDGEDVAHAQLNWPLGGGVMLGSYQGGELPPLPGMAAAYVVTDDPDGLFARAQEAGATIVTTLNDTEYGSRTFSVRDPEGNLWSFGTYRGEPLP
jgi:uncharacterized glyoxalase superfamily protein PhnB